MYRFPIDPRRTHSERTPSSARAPAATILAFVASCAMLGSLAPELGLAATAASPALVSVDPVDVVVAENQLPQTWFAGPNISQLSARFGWTGNDRHIDITDWNNLPDLSGTLLSCDSLTQRPHSRLENRTFFEIYENRLYVRAENDTVHMNSWIIVHGGGSDSDSPYLVKVADGDPALNDTLECASAGTPLTVRPAGVVGSPIGFRLLQGIALEPDSLFFARPQSGLFPIFDPLSVFRAPTIGAYRAMTRSGKVYLVLRSEDSDGGLDPSIPDAATARAIADHVDSGFGTPEEIALRPKILTFYVNQAPVLRQDDPAFVPQPGQVFTSRTISVNLLATDPDPYDPSSSAPVGGPSGPEVLRWNVKIHGLTFTQSVTISPLPAPVSTPQIDITVPDSLIGTHVTLEVELCDCQTCESLPGSGRCARYFLPLTVPNRGTPPLLVFDESQGVGPVVRSANGPIEIVTVPIRDSLDFHNIGTPPRDTIPAAARIEFRWHNEPTSPDYQVVGYRYKLDEPAFVEVDPTVTSVTYNTGIGGDVVSPGVKVFMLQVFGKDGPEGLSRGITRRFVVNYSPDSWFSGPDTTVLDARFGWSGHDRHLDVADWNNLPDLTGSLMSCDSLTMRPAERLERKTFFEVYQNRLYLRTEGDTVHMNSWVVLHGGGFDIDSPYDVRVAAGDPALDDTLVCAPSGTPWVVRPAGMIGSPIGMRSSPSLDLTPNGPFQSMATTGLLPVFDPASVFRAPVIAAYQAMSQAGKAYVVLRSEDGHGVVDNSVGSVGRARFIADRVDQGLGTPEEIALRRKILTFHVDQSPVLLENAAEFVPQRHQVFATRNLALNLLAADSDPFDPGAPPPGPGGPSAAPVLRWNVRLDGTDQLGKPVSYSPLPAPVFSPRIDVTVPGLLADTGVSVHVDVCDCRECEQQPGSGRCATYDIPIVVPGLMTSAHVSLVSAEASPAAVRVRWYLEQERTARVQRRTAATAWQDVGEVRADGSGIAAFEDGTVAPGARYGFQLIVGAERATGGEVWVDVPNRFELALDGLRPNPSRGGDLVVHFTLSSAEPARIEVLDPAGRRWRSRDVSLTPGAHAIDLRPGPRLPPGLYLVRLKQGGVVRVTRAAVLE